MIFVKLEAGLNTWDEEAEAVRKLREIAGVKAIPGKAYGGVDGEKGWVRLAFAVEEGVMRKAVSKMEKFWVARAREESSHQ